MKKEQPYELVSVENFAFPVTIIISPKGVQKISFTSPEIVAQHLAQKNIPYVFISHHPAAVQLHQYFDGKRKNFNIPMDIVGTYFQRQVWKALADIPYGETRSYKDIAVSIGCPKGFRAVGQACGANPLPILIPCHRVLAIDRKLGGFSAGLKVKKALLELEDIIPSL
jgi:methylated-DNA-[protein]-cysteine S-methyltransferase